MKFRPNTALSPKAARVAAAQEHTAVIGDQLTAPIVRDEYADIEHIPVHSIRPDAHQARRLGINLEMLRNPEGVTDPVLRANVDEIVGLAMSLKTVKQRMPIEVYRDGGVYRLLSGERRWWAAQLADIEKLAAKVLPERPRDLRLKQFTENVQRKGLTTAEMLVGLQGIVEETRALDIEVSSPAHLRERTGLTKSTASRWWAVLNGPQDVIEALVEGRVSVVQAEVAARIQDSDERSKYLAECSAGAKEDELSKVVRKVKDRTEGGSKRKRGRPTKMTFGSTSNVGVARVILQRVLGSEPADVDWNNPSSVNSAIKAMLKRLEEEFAKQSS